MPLSAASQQPQDRIAEIRIQGNYRTPEDEVLKIALIQVGDPITDQEIAALQERLQKSGKFDEVEVRKRWRTIDMTGDVVLLIVVREVPGGSSNAAVRMARSLTRPIVFPVFNYVDGYGFTYGGRVSPVGFFGDAAHVSIPLTWGSTRQAGFEVGRDFGPTALTRVAGGFAVRSRENPYFDDRELRFSLSARAERTLAPPLKVGAAASMNSVTFLDRDDDPLGTVGADVTYDTRRTPDMPRNAVFAQLTLERLFPNGTDVNRYRGEVRGYLGMPWASVFSVRASGGAASSALPPYEQFLFGGASAVRGFPAGHDAGDRMLVVAAEWRLPFTSPVGLGRTGVSVFADTGTVYDVGERLSGSHFNTGVGAGLFLNAAIFNLNLDIARGLNHGWRAHLSTGITF